MNPYGSNYNWSSTTQWAQPAPAPQYSAQNTGSIQNQPLTPIMQTTESRQDMIKRLYNTILGREPDVSGLNYFLYNTNLTEFDIAREMYESTEHAELLSKAKKIRKFTKENSEIQKQMSDMQYRLSSLEAINENFKALIDQKTQSINELRSRLGMAQESKKPNDEAETQDPLILLEDPFEEKDPSLLQRIKNWFKFG
jgi:hypothetical protein